MSGLKAFIGIDKLEAELILINPKDKTDSENDKKIDEFCSMLEA